MSIRRHIPHILVIDDEPDICSLLARLLIRAGFDVTTALSGAAALREIERGRFDALVLDYRLPDMTGFDLLAEVRQQRPHLPTVMITAYADVRGAVDAMRAGVYDYIAKPFENDAVVNIVKAALAGVEGFGARPGRHGDLSVAASLRESFGPSEAVGQLIARIELVANSEFSVLILGESGTGKELVAHAIHRGSQRRQGTFLPIDCGAIPEHLVESELFGYEKGAFTGAMATKPGKFTQAEGGTLFLDEIANLPLPSQAKLLRVLQERTLYRVGGSAGLPVNVRIVAAANEDLEKNALEGRFRNDLFFRLSEFVIHIPPLRSRPEDVQYNAHRFLKLTNAELGKAVEGFSEEAMRRLTSYAWPGNVRQLRNVIRQAVLVADGLIRSEHLPLGGAPANDAVPADPLAEMPAGLSLREIVQRNTARVERQAIEVALRQARGNKAEAARLLHIDYKTMHTKVKEYKINFKE